LAASSKYEPARSNPFRPWKSVWQNVALGLPGSGTPSRSQAALAEVGLPHRLDAWPATLSSGEAQRTALVRALVRAPGPLVLDEPFAALDTLTRLRMHALVLDLWTRHRSATLRVTHVPPVVGSLPSKSDRVTWIVAPMLSSANKASGQPIISAARETAKRHSFAPDPR
jgi:ABC-type nitrate/sulfonate/bicarbonate transport system ATPase subunit